MGIWSPCQEEVSLTSLLIGCRAWWPAYSWWHTTKGRWWAVDQCEAARRGCVGWGPVPVMWCLVVEELLERFRTEELFVYGYAVDVAIIASSKFHTDWAMMYMYWMYDAARRNCQLILIKCPLWSWPGTSKTLSEHLRFRGVDIENTISLK